MADANNHVAGRLPPEPDPALRQLDRLVGSWKIAGGSVEGVTTFEWMEGH